MVLTLMQALLDALEPGHPDLALAREIDPGRIPRHIAVIMEIGRAHV